MPSRPAGVPRNIDARNVLGHANASGEAIVSKAPTRKASLGPQPRSLLGRVELVKDFARQGERWVELSEGWAKGASMASATRRKRRRAVLAAL